MKVEGVRAHFDLQKCQTKGKHEATQHEDPAATDKVKPSQIASRNCCKKVEGVRAHFNLQNVNIAGEKHPPPPQALPESKKLVVIYSYQK